MPNPSESVPNQPPKKLSTDPYKGVRDFFPADMAIEKAIFKVWRDVCERYGYEEYGASVLEPADMYRAKSGEEIVNEQTYTFVDRGDREVTLRPEMTPTVARMVAAKRRELPFPVRWYSIPNLFRYEQPQRGRVREHWQLNVDIFGIESIDAEVETISMASDITKAYGLKEENFEVRINSRKLMNYVMNGVFGLDETAARKASKLIDKKDKMKPDAFAALAQGIFGAKTDDFIALLGANGIDAFAALLPKNAAADADASGLAELRDLLVRLKALGISNARFDQTLMRGFDYYTGIVFEVFDLNPLNRRSVFGGGRYDDLLSLFGNDKVTAVGFGAGDVVARDLMETYDALPKAPAAADYYLCIMTPAETAFAADVARRLRAKGSCVAVDFSYRKIGDQIKSADKRGIPAVIVIGPEEAKSASAGGLAKEPVVLTAKNLKDGTTFPVEL